MMPEEEVIITVRVPQAMDKALEDLALELQRNKSELVREAITTLIGMYKDAREKR